MDDVLKIFGGIALIIGLLFIMPIINFWLAYFGGWLVKVTIGGKVVAALNILFHTTYFTAEMLPMMAGALGWIGGFFKSYSTINKK